MKFIPFKALVVDVNDPEQGGRVKIRVFGDQDQIPESELRWARPVFPITNPIKGKVAGQTTGIMKGSRVFGFYEDDDKQHPYYIGTYGGSGKQGSTIDAPDQPRDFPPQLANTLPSGGQWRPGDLRLIPGSGNSSPSLDIQSLTRFAQLQAGAGPALFAQLQTIGTTLPNGFNASDFIKKIDPQNAAGALGSQIHTLLKNLQKNAPTNLTQMLGGQQIVSQVSSFIQQIMQQSQQNQTPQNNKQLDIQKLQLILSEIAIAQTVEQIQSVVSEVATISSFPDQVMIILNINSQLTPQNRATVVPQLTFQITNLITLIASS